MALLTSAAIKGYRDYTMRRIAYAKFKVGSTEYKTNIESVKVTDSGTVEIAFKIELASGSGTVSQISLYDTDNQLWLSKTENLQMDSVAEGFYYVVQLDIAEVTS
ncbi:hypothetical protein B5E53_07105 [Eubacterium sp. An11]|uniref:hypothetical protein n=1 Tax=Eubacterium sp. An11 TaxID=1965542 RepID=UPI000B3AF2F1|nr:hypothetical protein [Eubacterium sp. An11]OUQ68229.1 hypothetical protein B5E53_07105 [Eubacterium sp. An11]